MGEYGWWERGKRRGVSVEEGGEVNVVEEFGSRKYGIIKIKIKIKIKT